MKYLITFFLPLLLAAGAVASPGAHGPNGEHLDGPAGTAPAGAVPRVETFSEGFELVGQLSGGELSIMVDRYETNEPVLNGTVEVEYKGMKAPARFHADMGDYAVDDAKFIKAISAPGKHALLFTLSAGEDSDLLEGTLDVAAPAHDEHGHASPWRWVALCAGAVLLAVVAVRLRRSRQKGAP